IYEKSVPLLQRKKMARRMRKMAKSAIFKMKKARSALRRKTPEKILALARKKAINMIRKKFYPTYKDMAFAQRIKIDQRIMVQFGKKIDKISKKMAMIIKKGEGARIAKAKEAQAKAREKPDVRNFTNPSGK
ncbi:uncharacterized protein METZ01_LOCUS390673, partial [marine metagenome]